MKKVLTIRDLLTSYSDNELVNTLNDDSPGLKKCLELY